MAGSAFPRDWSSALATCVETDGSDARSGGIVDGREPVQRNAIGSVHRKPLHISTMPSARACMEAGSISPVS
jgi:hypothetical protein